jgi:hypothetical protein
MTANRHRHKWRRVGGCEFSTGVGYVRYRCACGARKLRYIVYGLKTGFINLKRRDTWDQHETP